MFEHDMVSTVDFNGSTDARYTYEGFLGRMDLNAEDFPFKVKTGKFFKGKEIVHTIRSWGSYQNASGEWMVFIAYYFAGMKHTTQYSWRCDKYGQPSGQTHKNEWIGG